MRHRYDDLNLQYNHNTNDLAKSRREINQLYQDLQRAKDDNDRMKIKFAFFRFKRGKREREKKEHKLVYPFH